MGPMGNDASFKSAVDSLSAGGGSPLEEGMGIGSTMLVLDHNRRRVMVILSDGEVCWTFDACEHLRQLGDWLKEIRNHIQIITVGNNLDGLNFDLMHSLASPDPDGQKLFVNSASSDALGQALEGISDRLCSLAELGLAVSPKRLFVARGGVGTWKLRSNMELWD